MIRQLQHYLSERALRSPEKIAVVDDEARSTFGELEDRSNRLARALREVGCRRGDRVCLLLPKGTAALVAMQGTLKADCAYVPIDLGNPAQRVASILGAIEPRALLAGRAAATLLDTLAVLDWPGAGTRIIDVDGDDLEGRRASPHLTRADWMQLPETPVESAGAPGDPAHILFTSGSTGVPKGVVVTHASVIAFVEWARAHFGIGEDERLSGHSPLHFDLSTFDIYGSFASGAELHLVHPELNLLPHRLADFIRRAALTQWFSVPSVLTYLASFDVLRHGDFPAMRRLLWCGEPMPASTLMHWMDRLPHVGFTNLYGPTETTIASSHHTVVRRPASDTESIPVGTACAGETLMVLDDHLHPVAPGAVGGIYIGGVGLSPGYWRDPERTAAAFVTVPCGRGRTMRLYRTGDLGRIDDEGRLHCLGRTDSQIKTRGHRVELGEVEAALGALDELAESVAVGVRTGGFEGTAICCAYAARDGARAEPAHLRRELARRLPGYMLPSRWKRLARLPRNPNGKIDRRLVQQLFEEESE